MSILFELEHLGISAWKPLSFPLEMENPDFSLSIAQAIVTAMDGSIAFRSLSETRGAIEIVLPLQYAAQDLVDAMNRRGSVLLIGSDLEALGAIEVQLEENRYIVIRCSSAAEALLLGQLHDGKIDCIIADADSVSGANRRRLRTLFSSRNSLAQFVTLTSEKQTADKGWQSLLKSKQGSYERLPSLLLAGKRAKRASS